MNLKPLTRSPMSSRWTYSGRENGFDFYRSRGCKLFAKRLSDGAWFQEVVSRPRIHISAADVRRIERFDGMTAGNGRVDIINVEIIAGELLVPTYRFRDGTIENGEPVSRIEIDD